VIFILITKKISYVTCVNSTCDYKMHYAKHVSVTAHFLRPYMITNKGENM